MIPFVLSFVRCAKDVKVGDLSAGFCHALMEAHLSQKAAAIAMFERDDKEVALSRQINEFGLNLHRMLFLPKAFWRVFLPKLAKLVDCEDQILLAQTADYMRSLDKLRARMEDLERQITQLRTDRGMA